ncbi:hypothetical protein Sjap_008863 [Stephania japonica]|uniref:F-box protein n=1 Tax=Stephania japonica TaxID=461633 RepID=A0AAP0JQW1_9MAGN
MSVKGENLCLLVGDQEAHSYNIYVMTKYGVRESWCKIYTIPDPPKMDKFGPCWKTFCFTNNGRILLQGEMDYLLLYDPKRARFAKLKVHRYLTRRSTAIHAYVPSLMPISSILGENVVAKKTSLIEAILAAPAPSDFAPSNVYSQEFSSCFSFALSRILCLFCPKFLFSWAYHHLVPKKWLFHWWICAT